MHLYSISNAVRYSPTAVEVTWVRTPDVFTAFYELSRNGVLIDDRLGALSYYDSNAASNQEWTYELVAVDADGNRSEISSITIPANSTGTGTPPPVNGGIEPPDITGTAYSTSDIEIF